jgi:hypothetical protein
MSFKIKITLFFFSILIISIISLVSFKSYKLVKQKNDKLNYAYNSIDYLKLEIEKTHLEAGYIRNIYDKKYMFRKFNLRNLLNYNSDNYERPFGFIDFFDKKIIFVSGKGKIFISNDFNGNVKKLQFNEINTNLKNEYDFLDEPTYQRNYIRDILIDGEELYLVILDIFKINDEIKYSTKIVKTDFINNDYLEFDIFFSIDEYGNEGSVDITHGGGRLIKYKDNKFLFTIPDFGVFAEKAQIVKSPFGKIVTIDKITQKYDVLTLGHRNPQGLYWDSERDIIISSEHGPIGGDEINIIEKGKNYGWPLVSYGAGDINIKSKNHSEYNFREPAYHFVDFNCGPSEIIKIPENFLNQKKDSFLLACLSGADPLYGKALYNFTLNEDKLDKIQKIFINDRIRDMKIFNENILIMTLENSHSLGFIYK